MNILFHWIGGATFILSIGNLQIAVDPVLCEKGTVQDYFWFKSKRIENPSYEDKDFHKIDLWLITHKHEDHLDSIGLSKINDPAQIITNKNASKILKAQQKKNLNILDWHQTKKIELKGYTIEITAIPAIHGINPVSAFLAGKVNGYYLSIQKGTEKTHIYITGDTVYKKKIVKTLKNKPIDLLVPNMGAAKQGSWIMTLTLNAKMLQKLSTALQPAHIIPVHYGTFQHYREPVEQIAKLNNPKIHIIEVGSKTELKLNKPAK